jgi:putative membrane protein
VQLVRADWQLVQRYRRLRWSAFGLLFVPALYALIYLGSVWDPAAHTRALPVGLVNADEGLSFRGRSVQLGGEVLRRLQAQGQFGYRVYHDEASAQQAVRAGELQFALLIPADFSAQAVPGNRAGAGRILIYASEGNNYAGAGFAKRFAPELAHQLNETLNVQRWAFVLKSSADADHELDDLRSGVNRLAGGAAELVDGSRQLRDGLFKLDSAAAQAHDGATQLHHGSGPLSSGGTALVDGVRTLGSGLRAMQERLPSDAELHQLKRGAGRVAGGSRNLLKGLDELQEGAQKLEAGTGLLKTEAAKVPFGGDPLVEALRQLEDGTHQLGLGLAQSNSAGAQLAGGAERLEVGVATLSEGVGQFGGGVRQMVAALPPEAELARLHTGLRGLGNSTAALDDGLKQLSGGATQLAGASSRLVDGASQLQTGLKTLAAALPPGAKVPEGSADGLAESVQPVLAVVAPVGTNGAGFAPNFMALALWVGAAMTSFLWSFRRVSAAGQGGSGAAIVLGKLAVPAAMVLMQALIMGMLLPLMLSMPQPSLLRFLATLALGALAFLALQFMLVSTLGEPGKVVGLLLLIVQLAAGGGTLPVELSSSFYQALHPWLPFTWVIRALRVALFGAYDGAWWSTVGVVAATLAAALALAALFGRWRWVPAEHYQPALDMD